MDPRWPPALLLILGACSDRSEPAPELPPLPERVVEVQQLDRGEPRAPRELRIALSGELRGEVEPCGCPTLPYGGFARREVLLDSMRAEGPPVFQLDAGEALLKGVVFGGRRAVRQRGEAVVDLMVGVGVDAMTAGPSDLLAVGLDGLRAAAGRGLRVLSATWVDDRGRTVLPPATVIERGGLRLGVVGLSAKPRDPALRGLVGWRDPVGAARAELADLPRDLDLVVALSNLPDEEAERVAGQVPELAVVLGTRGSRLDPPHAVAGVARVETPARGRYLTVIDLWLASVSGRAPLFDGDLVERVRRLDHLRATRRRLREGGGAAGAIEGLERSVRELRGELSAEAGGLNLAWVEDRPLGTRYDREGTRSAERIERFKDEILRRAARSVAEAAPPAARGPRYASSAGCVSCHTSQFARWTFTAHSKALLVLTERRRDRDPECVACHSTGFGKPGGFAELNRKELSRLGAVQCEACHGPLGGHPEDEAVQPQPVTERTCRGCHDPANSPAFDYRSYLPRVACLPGSGVVAGSVE